MNVRSGVQNILSESKAVSFLVMFVRAAGCRSGYSFKNRANMFDYHLLKTVAGIAGVNVQFSTIIIILMLILCHPISTYSIFAY